MAAAFTGAMVFPNDGGAIGVYCNPDPGGVDGKEGAAVLAGKHAFGFRGLPVPAVKAKDPIGLTDCVPALDVA